MKKNFTILCLLLLFSVAGTAQQWKWGLSFGQPDGSNDSDAKNTVHRIGKDANGNIYISGSFRDFLKIDNKMFRTVAHRKGMSSGTYDIYIAKLDTSGKLLWAQQWLGENNLLYDMFVDAEGNVFITGAFSNGKTQVTPYFSLTNTGASWEHDIYIAKYNTNGVLSWAKNIGGNKYDFGHAIQGDNKGNLFLAGYFTDTVKFGSTTVISKGNEDIFLAGLDTAGNFNWVKTFGGTGRDEMSHLTIDKNSNVYVCGRFTGNVNFGLKTLTNSGSGFGNEDLFVAKFSKSGAMKWIEHLECDDEVYGLDMALDNDNNIYLGGYLDGTLTAGDFANRGNKDAFLVKYDSLGNTGWLRAFGGEMAEDGIKSIYVNENNKIFIGGYFSYSFDYDTLFYPESNGNSFDAFVVEINSQGKAQWYMTTGGTGTEYIRDMIVDKDRNIYLGGFQINESNFGAISFNSQGNDMGYEDMFLVKYGPYGNTSIDTDTKLARFNIYPNPAAAHVNISMPQTSGATIQISITDVSGKKIWSNAFPAGNNLEIDLGFLSNGLYMIEAQTVEKIYRSKVIKY